MKPAFFMHFRLWGLWIPLFSSGRVVALGLLNELAVLVHFPAFADAPPYPSVGLNNRVGGMFYA